MEGPLLRRTPMAHPDGATHPPPALNVGNPLTPSPPYPHPLTPSPLGQVHLMKFYEDFLNAVGLVGCWREGGAGTGKE